MKKKSILVISQYFYPEQFRINDICEEWVKKGYEVTVITGKPNYPHGKFYKGYGLFKKRKENYKGIDIIRLPIIPRGNNPIMLILNYLSFVFSGWIWSITNKVIADSVFIYEVSPMTQALPGIWYAKKNKVPVSLYVTDLWPENVEIVTGLKNKTILNILGRMVDYIYENSTYIFTASKSFVRSISKRGVSLDKIEFWPQYAEDFYKPLNMNYENEIPVDDSINILFAGNIGYAQGLELLPKCAFILKEKGVKVRFNIVGDGRYKNKLISIVKEKGLENFFNFIEKKPAIEIPKYIKNSDIALISLSKSEVFSQTIPAKTQSCLACGIPIIVSADGEVQEIIKDAECGFVGGALDYHALANNILSFSSLNEKEKIMMGSNALSYYMKNFNKYELLEFMDNYIGGN